MIGEINQDLFCVGNHTANNGIFDYCDYKGGRISLERCKHCNNCHHKWPTFEQFEEEYGEEYPDYGAVYLLSMDNYGNYFYEMQRAKYYKQMKFLTVVCACTPWGNPSGDWRSNDSM